MIHYDSQMPTLSIKKVGTGFLLEYGNVRFGLDTGIKGVTTLLSHSHSDHIGHLKNTGHIIATKETFETWNARRSSDFRNMTRTEIKYDDTFGQIEANITALNAGHVIGSSMFLIEYNDGLTVLYTGDFNNVDSLVHKAAKPIEADVLITEATYGAPSWIFPKRKTVYENIMDEAMRIIDNGRIPLFHAYSLGKSQEAIALLQSAGFRVISGNTTIDKICSVYKRHGFDLKHLSLRASETSKAIEEGAVIVSSSSHHTLNHMKRLYGEKKFAKIEPRIDYYDLSGWTIGKFRRQGFPLSAHSDFSGLLNFAKSVNPRIAYCFTENGRTLSKHLSDNGINAVPLE
ncbi:MAG: MBL fold metallo-hydrolase [Promethearchaeota archaeon]